MPGGTSAKQRWVDAHFHLLDDLMLYQRAKRGERSANGESATSRCSSFTWNEIVFRSFQAGNLKKLDLEFYHSTQVGSRQADLSFSRQAVSITGMTWRFNLARFACEHIGLSRQYDTAQLKRRLNPAIAELEQAGFLTPAAAKGAVSPVATRRVGSRFRPCSQGTKARRADDSAVGPGESAHRPRRDGNVGRSFGP